MDKLLNELETTPTDTQTEESDELAQLIGELEIPRQEVENSNIASQNQTQPTEPQAIQPTTPKPAGNDLAQNGFGGLAIELMDEFAAEGLAKIAKSDSPEDYQADKKDLDRLTKHMNGMLNGVGATMPPWQQFIICFVVAYGLKLKDALKDRKQANVIERQQTELEQKEAQIEEAVDTIDELTRTNEQLRAFINSPEFQKLKQQYDGNENPENLGDNSGKSNTATVLNHTTGNQRNGKNNPIKKVATKGVKQNLNS
jgi:hypothetical protein